MFKRVIFYLVFIIILSLCITISADEIKESSTSNSNTDTASATTRSVDDRAINSAILSDMAIGSVPPIYIPEFGKDIDIDSYTTTWYKPWMALWHLTKLEQIEIGYRGGEAGQAGQAIAVSPINSDLLLCGTDTGSSWRSENGGRTWRSAADGLLVQGVVDFAFDPDDENIAYAAATGGEKLEKLQRRDGELMKKVGLYKSYDRGKTWHFKLNTPFTQRWRRRIHFGTINQHGNRKMYFAAEWSGVYLSEDMGETWTNIGLSDEQIYEFIVDGDVLIVATSENGFFVSRDSGATWEPKNNGMENLISRSAVVNPRNRNHWFAVTETELYESLDAGENWIKINTSTNIKAKRIMHLRIGWADNEETPTLYLTQHTPSPSVRCSWDYGRTFDVDINRYAIHSDYAFIKDNDGYYAEPIAVDPINQNVAYAFFDGELYKTKDSGRSFYPLNSGYSGMRASYFDFNPDDENDVMVSIIDRGWVRTVNSGHGEKYLAVNYEPQEDRYKIRFAGSKDSISSAIDPKNPDRVLISRGRRSDCILKESLDKGLNFHEIAGTEHNHIKILEFHPQNPQIIYAGQLVSYDDGVSWIKSEKIIWCVSPVDGDVVYSVDGNDIYKSIDCAKSWVKLNSEYIGTPVRLVSDVVDKDKIYIGTFNGSFLKYENNAFVKVAQFTTESLYGVAQNPRNPDHMIVAGLYNYTFLMSEDFYETFDGGKTWRQVEGLQGSKDVWVAEFHPTLPRVYFGTSAGTFIYEYEKYFDMSEKYYLDIDNSYAKEYINRLYENDILDKYNDGYFKPDKQITRGEFIEIVAKGLDLKRNTSKPAVFSDVPDNYASWNYVSIQAMYESGIINGSQDSKFEPNRAITYEEAAIIISRMLRYSNIYEQVDISKINSAVPSEVSNFAKYSILSCYYFGILKDNDIFKFKADKPLIRQDAAIMLDRAFDITGYKGGVF